MKPLLALLALMLMIYPAHAETKEYAGRVREDMPMLTITVTQTAYEEDAERPYTLCGTRRQALA